MKKFVSICVVMLLPLLNLLVAKGNTTHGGVEVRIGNPAEGQMIEEGSRVFVEAAVRNEQDKKVAVIFRVNGEPLGEADGEFPYQSPLWDLSVPGAYRIEAIAVDAQGTALSSDAITIYCTPESEHRRTAYDPMRSHQDFLYQIYTDLLCREPGKAELADYLEKLEYGEMTRIEVIDAISKTREFQHLLTAQSAYKAILGEWPSPEEFSDAVRGTEESAVNPPPAFSDDVEDQFESAHPLSSDHPVFSGILGGHADIDMFRFHLTEETHVGLTTTGAFDTTGSLFDEAGNLLASDDDSGEFFNFALEQTLPPGDYYLSVSGWAGTEGSYNLQLQLGNDTPGSFTEPESPIDPEQIIHSLYTSGAFVESYGPLGDLLEEENVRNRLFGHLFTHRFGRGPTLPQIREGAEAILKAGSIESFTADFLRHDGEGEFFISDLPETRDRDEAAYLIRSLLKVRPTRNRIHWLLGKSFREKTTALLDDPFYVARFAPREPSRITVSNPIENENSDVKNTHLLNLSFAANPEHSTIDDNPFASLEQTDNGWKYLDWFGWFSDRDYPWLYHENMGWISVKPMNRQEMFLWHNRFEWAYTGADSYPYLYRYLDNRWIRLDYEAQPGAFEVIEVAPETGNP